MSGKHTRDEDTILHIVSHLPSEYDTIVDIAMKQLTLKMPTLDILQKDLQLKFDYIKIKNTRKMKLHLWENSSKEDVVYVAR
jgi:hypothetical protein